MNDKLKEAVERKKERMKHHGYAFKQDKQDDKMFVDLAESYLSIQGFPEELKVSMVPGINEGYWVGRINKTLKDCKLALLKKMGGIEKICFEHISIGTSSYYKISLNLAQAIRDHLTK